MQREHFQYLPKLKICIFSNYVLLKIAKDTQNCIKNKMLSLILRFPDALHFAAVRPLFFRPPLIDPQIEF